MRKKRIAKILSLIMAVSMFTGMVSACKKTDAGVTTTPAPVESTAAQTTAAPINLTPLVVGYSLFSEKFSPFFSDTDYDADVSRMAQEPLLTTDRTGGIIS